MAAGAAATVGTALTGKSSAAGESVAAGARARPTVALASAADRHVLRDALSVERLVIWGYEHVLAHGTLEPSGLALVSELHGHERAHLMVLQEALSTPPEPALGDAAAAAALARHSVAANPAHLGTQRQSLRLLVDLESVAEGAWFAAIAQLQSPALARVGAEIMASEAQHWTLLSGLSHHGDARITVPNAFVRGA